MYSLCPNSQPKFWHTNLTPDSGHVLSRMRSVLCTVLLGVAIWTSCDLYWAELLALTDATRYVKVQGHHYLLQHTCSTFFFFVGVLSFRGFEAIFRVLLAGVSGWFCFFSLFCFSDPGIFGPFSTLTGYLDNFKRPKSLRGSCASFVWVKFWKGFLRLSQNWNVHRPTPTATFGCKEEWCCEAETVERSGVRGSKWSMFQRNIVAKETVFTMKAENVMAFHRHPALLRKPHDQWLI